MAVSQRSLDRSIQRTLRLALAGLFSVIVLATVLLVGGSHDQGARLDTVFNESVVPMHDLQRIGYLLNVVVPTELTQDAADARSKPEAAQQATWKEVDRLWQKYLATYLDPQEQVLARRAGEQLDELRLQLAAAQGGAADAPVALYQRKLLPLNASLNALVDLQVKQTEGVLMEARSANSWIWGLGLLVGALGLALVGAIVHAITQRIVLPIRASADAIAALADGRFNLPPGATELPGEFAAVSDQLRRLQSLLAERERLLHEEQQTTLLLRSVQADLIEAEKLASLGSLVAGVAHELNTPLGVAVAVSSSLGDKSRRFAADVAAGPIRRSQLEAFVLGTSEGAALIEKNMMRAAELIRSFRQVAVDRAGMQRRRFDLGKVVDEVIVSLRPAYGRNKVQMVSEVPIGLMFESYPGAIGQVISNLLINAVVHGLQNKPGLVRVTVPDAQRDPLQLCVIDDGAGMTPEVQARAFEPFFSTRLGQGGSGLGLAIVRNIVNAVLGGRITLRSAPGEGCCFTVELPRIAPDAADMPELGEKILFAAEPVVHQE